jgi:ankyrin repeat protein
MHMQLHIFQSKSSFISLHTLSSRMSVLEDFAKAIENGDSSQVESLLTGGSIDVNARLPRKFNPPPLLLAVRCDERCVRIVEILLNSGAHIDGVDDNLQTASLAATLARSVDVLAVLLLHRPNLEIADVANSNPLQISLKHMVDRISVMLINAGASLDVGFEPGSICRFASRSTSAIQALLSRGANMNDLCDPMLYTPLHLASRRMRSFDLDVVNMLINVGGIDLEAQTMQGKTCTHIAASGNDIALRCFINAGADVNCADRVGQTPLHFVSNYPKCAVLLVAAGANVNARDRDGRTALNVAVNWNWTVVLPVFLAAGADPSDVSGQSIAAVSDHQVEAARCAIAKVRLDFVRYRATEVCVGLQSLHLDALQLCEILRHSCGPLARLIAFHQWWTIATTVKHFHRH